MDFLGQRIQYKALKCRNVHSNELNYTIVILMSYLAPVNVSPTRGDMCRIIQKLLKNILFTWEGILKH